MNYINIILVFFILNNIINTKKNRYYNVNINGNMNISINNKRCIDSNKIIDGICTEEYNPVCGCDGKTYGNPCKAKINGVLNYTFGECKDLDNYFKKYIITFDNSIKIILTNKSNNKIKIKNILQKDLIKLYNIYKKNNKNILAKFELNDKYYVFDIYNIKIINNNLTFFISTKNIDNQSDLYDLNLPTGNINSNIILNL